MPGPVSGADGLFSPELHPIAQGVSYGAAQQAAGDAPGSFIRLTPAWAGLPRPWAFSACPSAADPAATLLRLSPASSCPSACSVQVVSNGPQTISLAPWAGHAPPGGLLPVRILVLFRCRDLLHHQLGPAPLRIRQAGEALPLAPNGRVIVDGILPQIEGVPFGSHPHRTFYGSR